MGLGLREFHRKLTDLRLDSSGLTHDMLRCGPPLGVCRIHTGHVKPNPLNRDYNRDPKIKALRTLFIRDHALNGDYNRDPNIKAVKRRGFTWDTAPAQ